MNVIIQINGREAIPVRAIPLLTYWQTMTPDALAQALAGEEHFYRFKNMQAYLFDGGMALKPQWWPANVVRPLLALSDTIRASEISHESGLQEFHIESLKKLPAGVFVWRDEFAQAHHRHYSKTTLPLDCDGNDLHLSDAEAAKLTAEHQERIALDFSPFIDAATHAVVMQGFIDVPPDTAPDQTAPVETAKAESRQTTVNNYYITQTQQRNTVVVGGQSNHEIQTPAKPTPSTEQVPPSGVAAPSESAATPAPVVAASDGSAKPATPSLSYEAIPALAKQTATTMAGAIDGPAKPAAPVGRGWVMKKAALIKKHEHQWETINRDFQDASENGLSKTAKAPGHGDWFEAAALDWARQRGKLKDETAQHASSPATPFSGLVHRIKG